MPEQISKYPKVTLQVLQSAGARCGEGGQQQILTDCPPERFCALSGGEVCVYGLEQIPQMTQISAQELAAVVCPPGAGVVGPLSGAGLAVLGAVFCLGLAIGLLWRRMG